VRSRLALTLGLVGALVAAPDLQAQNRTVTGRVFDQATQQGIAGAVITIAGSTRVTQANEGGQFRVIVPSTDVTLVVRGLGYRRVEVRVAAAQEVANVGMQREALRLTEVVVTGAATTQERRSVGTAVSTVQADELARVPAMSLDNAMQGKVVGAQINMNSGAPGGGGQIQIRGVTSILGNGEPLFVVDGVIISNAQFSAGANAISRASGAVATSTQDNPVNRLSDINPNEIENVQVLKSAAATAIYGSKATNGVVIITTKRGRSGAPRFSVSQRLGVHQATRLIGSRRFTHQTLADLMGSTFADQYCPGAAAAACPYYDYQDDLYGQSDPSYETSATLSGGSDATKYFVAINDKDDRGTLINTGARRQNLRLNLDQALGSRWTTNFAATLNRSVSERGISNNDNTFTSPYYGLAYTPAVINLQEQVGGRYIDNPALDALFGTGSNPYQTLNAVRNREDVWRQLGSGQVRFSAITTDQHSLTLQAMGGFDRFDAEGQAYSPNFLQFEPDDGFAGTAVQAEALSRQYNGTVSAVHTFTPAGSGILRFLSSATTSAGLQYEDQALNRFTVMARGLVPGIDLIDQGTPQLTQTKEIVRNQAFFVNEELLALDERLSLSGRVRGERSSVNGDREKFFYWPAASAAYRFVNLFPHADEIKLRAAWGTSGSQPTYGRRDVVIAGLGLIEGRTALGVPATIGNPNIKPERMRELEYGVDALFLNSRVGVEASYFDRTITDLLLTAPLAPTSGFTNRFVNGGEMKTAGVEFALSLTPVRTRNVTWTSRTQFFTFKSTIESLPDEVADFVIANSGFGAQYGRGRIARGQKTTLIWGNKYRGNVDPRLGAVDSTAVDTALADANPKFQMAFANDLSWRGFTLTTLLDWRKGGYVSNMTQSLFDEGGNSWDYDKPSPDDRYGSLGEYRYSEWNAGRNAIIYIQDGSYVKLREVTLSYAVPASLTSRISTRAHDLRVALTGRNLGIWSKYWSFDPEVNNFGNQNVVRFVDLAPFPPTRSWFLAVDLGF
jgi:TonB-linked SusC/RagA family outer membrane protein